MTPEEQRDYVKYRMERAYDTAEEAKTLFEEDHLHGAVNRVYYAMFYAVSALALAHGFSTSSHAQLRGYFNREFVKTGKVPVPLGRSFGFAYDNRTKGDYQDLAEFETEQVEELVKDAESFIKYLSKLLQSDESPGVTLDWQKS